MKRPVTLRINGRPHTFEVEPRAVLVRDVPALGFALDAEFQVRNKPGGQANDTTCDGAALEKATTEALAGNVHAGGVSPTPGDRAGEACRRDRLHAGCSLT